MRGPNFEKYRLVNENSRQVEKYRYIVFYATFIAYVNSHLSRKCYTNLKVQLEDAGFDTSLLSRMDAVFMLFFAFGSFFMATTDEKFHAPSVVGLGLCGCGFSVLLLAVGVWTDIVHQNSVSSLCFMAVWIVHGFMQSVGGPVNTAIMGNWFGIKNRGFIFGTWTCHQYVGNILAAVLASGVIQMDVSWTWALLIPSLANITWGIVCIVFLPEKPEHVRVELADVSTHPTSDEENEDDAPSFTLKEALLIPNVLGYSVAFGFLKLMNYTMFFWLPYFLSQFLGSGEGNLVSALYDIGMIPGVLIVGSASEFYGGRRACVVVTFMLCLVPFLALFSVFATTLSVSFLIPLLAVIGLLIGGPSNIITSAVAADLSERAEIRGNAKALGTVTSLINGIGSILAALGLFAIGPLQQAYGWGSVWRLMMVSAVGGSLLIGPQVYKELYHHDGTETPLSASRSSSYDSLRAVP